MSDLAFTFHFGCRGKIIPADLEAKILDAKQKVFLKKKKEEKISYLMFLFYLEYIYNLDTVALTSK